MLFPSRTTPRHRRGRSLLAAVALVATPMATVAAGPTSGYPQGTTIRPGSLERGADTPLLHREGRAIVDGPLRIRLDAPHLDLLGRSAHDYVVLTSDENYENARLVRVDRAGTTTTLRRLGNVTPEAHLSPTGARVLLATSTQRAGTRLQVVETRSGDVLRTRTFLGPVQVLAHGRRRAVLTEWTGRRTRTFWWNPARNTTRRISDHPGYRADIPQNRLGLWLGDPYTGGCQKLVRLDRPRTLVWRSCSEIVFELSPDAERMVTGHILSDGPGPRVIQVRREDGRLLRTYRSEWFGFWRWETDRRLLLQVGGKESVAAVRCTLRGCQRASRLFPREGRDPWQVMRWQLPG
jgi:hypothetical protein